MPTKTKPVRLTIKRRVSRPVHATSNKKLSFALRGIRPKAAPLAADPPKRVEMAPAVALPVATPAKAPLETSPGSSAAPVNAPSEGGAGSSSGPLFAHARFSE